MVNLNRKHPAKIPVQKWSKIEVFEDKISVGGYIKRLDIWQVWGLLADRVKWFSFTSASSQFRYGQQTVTCDYGGVNAIDYDKFFALLRDNFKWVELNWSVETQWARFRPVGFNMTGGSFTISDLDPEIEHKIRSVLLSAGFEERPGIFKM